MSNLRYYKLFGLNVEANINLNIMECKPCKADVIIEVEAWEAACVDDDLGEFHIHGINDIGVDIHNLARFRIQDGKSMLITPHKSTYWENELVTYIVGVAFATLLLQRDIFSIHGSAVCANDLAFIILGEAGAGKSSLARQSIRSGYKLLSDDLSAISTKNQLYVIPSFPTQKMWKDTMDVYEYLPDPKKQIFPNAEKFYVDIQEDFEETSKRLGAIIWLEASDVDQVTLTRLNKTKALEVLLTHAYIEEMVERLALKAQQLNLLSYVLSHADVYHLERPREGFTSKEQLHLIEQELFFHKKM